GQRQRHRRRCAGAHFQRLFPAGRLRARHGAALEIRARQARRRSGARLGADSDFFPTRKLTMEPQQAIGFASFLAQTDAVGRAILAALLLLPIATWYLIATKAIRLWIERRKSATFLAAFWNAASIPAVEKHIGEHHPEEPFSHLAWHAITASRHHQRHGA